MRTLPSTLIRRCFTILSTSLPVSAYLSRLRRKITSGRHSRSLCGPVLGRGAYTPPSLSNIHALGAFKRFKCFFGPRACTQTYMKCTGHLSARNVFPIPLAVITSKSHNIYYLYYFTISIKTTL